MIGTFQEKLDLVLENQARIARVLSALLHVQGVSAGHHSDGSSLHTEMDHVARRAGEMLGREVTRVRPPAERGPRPTVIRRRGK